MIRYSHKQEDGTYIHEDSYVGTTLIEREENYADDSDFYALCWDEEKQAVIRVDYATTRFAGGGNATVDATLEAILKAEDWVEKQFKVLLQKRNERDSVVPLVGRQVKVVRGRKVPIGTEGRVFYYKQHSYGYGRSWEKEFRVGIETADGTKYFTAAKNVEVLNPLSYIQTDEELSLLAKKYHSISWLPSLFSRCSVIL